MGKIKKETQFEIKQVEINGEPRYCLEDVYGKVIDDAQGYGYKTIQSASKAGWYKFNGGKETVNTNEKLAKKFSKEHPKILEEIDYIRFYALKDGDSKKEVEESIIELLKEHNVELPVGAFKYL